MGSDSGHGGRILESSSITWSTSGSISSLNLTTFDLMGFTRMSRGFMEWSESNNKGNLLSVGRWTLDRSFWFLEARLLVVHKGGI